MLNAKRPHFFEGFNPSSSSELLKIPSKFIKHMEGRTSGLVSLMGPSGNTWHVDLIQCKDGLLFHDGWATFVRDHSIERGDSLVFRYDGNLHFTVQVFDQSSCEKDTTFSAVCSQDHSDIQMGKKRERENTSFCLDDIFECVPKKTRGCVTVAQTCEPGIYSDGTENLSKTVTYAIPLQSRLLSENSGGAIQNAASKEDELGSYAGACMPLLSASEAERVAQSFTSPFPYFVKVMKRFNVSGSYTLNIPYQFSMEHLPKCKVKIVLHNLKGQSWTVNTISTTRVQTSHTFCGGWMAFVRENKLEMGDICIFELVQKCELRVQILWVGTEGLDRQTTTREAIKCLTNGTNGRGPSSHKTTEHFPKKKRGNSRKSQLQKISKVDLSGKKGSDLEVSIKKVKHSNASKSCAFSRSKAPNGKWESVNVKKSSLNDKQGFHTKGCMSMKSAPEEKLAAQLFISTFPHFVRVMKKFNISGSYTLKIPYQFSMEHLPSCRTEIILCNLRGECWTVNSIPTTKVQTLHTFCGGWMAFVRGNDIQLGDICIFELIGKCEMRVHISGVGKKGVDYQSGNAASNELTLGSSVSNHLLFQNSQL